MSLKQWNIIHAIAISTGIILFHSAGVLWPVLLLACLSLILLWVTQWYTISHLKPLGGYGNMITLFRYIIILVIIAKSGTWPLRITGLFLIIPFLLDGMDGFLTKKMNQVSKFGALFDLETDSLFVALSGLVLWNRNLAATWILPAMYMRYFYIGLLIAFRLLNAKDKRTFFGPAVAFLMFISIILTFIFPSMLSKILLLIASALVILSFCYSFYITLYNRSID